MTDQELLRRMGMSEHEIRDLLQKLNDFFNTLNPAQKRAFLKGQREPHEGAAELDQDVTPERLETFLKKFGPPGGIICIWCDVDIHHKRK